MDKNALQNKLRQLEAEIEQRRRNLDTPGFNPSEGFSAYTQKTMSLAKEKWDIERKLDE